jgi:hypothetical protein
MARFVMMLLLSEAAGGDVAVEGGRVDVESGDRGLLRHIHVGALGGVGRPDVDRPVFSTSETLRCVLRSHNTNIAYARDTSS